MTDARYNPFEIEPKWQKVWAERESFKVDNSDEKDPYYVLEMFPYPSGKIHMGHVRNYTLGDVLARFKRAQGYSVLHPMGWDAFGMPAENAAIKGGRHPREWTLENIKEMKGDFNKFGLSLDWSREVTTCEPEYYGHQQAFFIDMMKEGLVYQKEAEVNWDPVDMTVLANEQVIDGKGWRSGAAVERKLMKQYFVNITKYADELLEDIDTLENWPEPVKHMQRNWIGKSQGLKFNFDLEGRDDKLEVFTTRPDTIMGVTFCSVAAEHPLTQEIAKQNPEVQKFVEECKALGTALADIEKAEKKGIDLGIKAIHPITGEVVPVYAANFVLMNYGTGGVMAVPAHDERDYAFATKYNIAIKQVIKGDNMPEDNAYVENGVLVNSGEFDGLDNETAKQSVIDKMTEIGCGAAQTNYKLRDWGMSRQRYWGTPIPVVHCADCGSVPEKKEKLPVELPMDVVIDGSGNPLNTHATWKHTSCPKCGKPAERETDTMDTFMDSSWYYARYCSPQATEMVDTDAVNRWMSVDQYIGGIEHAILHLLYARFVNKAMRDVGLHKVNEPFKRLLCQGMVVANAYEDSKGDYIYPNMVRFEENGKKAIHTETGEELIVHPMMKVSKSKNNGENPNTLLEKYGADTLRLFMMFIAPPERDLEWSDAGIEGSWRFMRRLWDLQMNASFDVAAWSNEPVSLEMLDDKKDQGLKRSIHKTIRKMTEDTEKFQYNTLVASAMELSNALSAMKGDLTDAQKSLYREGLEAILRCLNPVTPHITEEMWQQLGYTELLVDSAWPEFDAKAVVDDEITMVVQVNGKLKERLTVPADISKEDAEKQALEAVETHIAELTVRKCIVVPKRLVNIVAN